MTPRVRSWLYLALLGVALLSIALVVRSGIYSRQNSGKPITGAMREATEGRALSAEDKALIAEKFPDARSLPSGLMYVPRGGGTGLETPRAGNWVTAHYDGKLLDGTPFDSSYKRGAPIEFKVGVGDVIKGWDEALLSMRRGEKRTLIIPYWIGYGTTGTPKIPPRATLVFEVELLNFR